MIILTMRTDKPESEIGIYAGGTQLTYETWQAHRQLAETIHLKIIETLEGVGKRLEDVAGIVCFQGPGSFTGLRIGLSVANALSYSLHVPIVATQDPDWLQKGITALQSGESEPLALPYYGADAHITTPKK